MTSSHWAEGPKLPSFCVYTTLIGDYESLNEQPAATDSRIPFVCLTDNPNLSSNAWQVRLVGTLFKSDSVRSQRALKLRPYDHLPDFDASLYIDNSIILTKPPERLIELFDLSSGLCLVEHSFRNTLLDEFVEVAKCRFDDLNRISEQLEHYRIEYPKILDTKPYWTGIMLRDHRNLDVRAMLEIWFAHVMRYSRRDQLSVNLALDRAALRPQVLELNNFASEFHSWPHVRNRDQTKSTPGRLNSKRRGSDVSIHVDPNDDGGRVLISSGGKCNPPTLAIWSRLIASENWTHVIDVGANYGEMLFNVMLPPAARVIAFEPNPKVAPYLEINLLCAGVEATVVRQAVSNEVGTAKLLVDRRWSSNSRLAASDRSDDNAALLGLSVPTTTIAEAFGGPVGARGIRALIKIDVGGQELRVLKGAMDVLYHFEDFAALVEILRVNANERAWLVDHFCIEVFNLETEMLELVTPGTIDRLSELLADKRYYGQDVVLRRSLLPLAAQPPIGEHMGIALTSP